jgi:4-amino-4-deoxy-L-arabinose transferase-like glycosyltransferase
VTALDRPAEPRGKARPAPPVARTDGVARLDVAVRELVALAAIVAVAALVRFLDLPGRGMWDADQGHDMLVLRALVHDGVIPLLGPPTSIGTFHHGVLYYYLLAPFAAVSAADPVAVVGAIAAAGVAAVVVTWWLARSIGGAIAGLVAAGLMAVSAAAIAESTFIWNPNLIALSSAIAFAAAWRAWTTGRARWWVVAAAAQAVTMHCHVLGVVLLVPLGGLLVADIRRREPGDPARARIRRAALAGAGLIVLSYVPLAISELQTGFAETHAAAAFLAGGGAPGAAPLPVRVLIVGLRILAWPLAGLITDAPAAALAAAAAVLAILAWRSFGAPPRERFVVRWFALTLGWSAGALALGAATLATVVPGLPNDHYHAFLDPLVFVTTGLGAAALWHSRQLIARSVAAAGVAALVAFNVLTWPPQVAPDRGWPAAEQAAARISATVHGRAYGIASLPTFKSADAIAFPLTRAGDPPAMLQDPMAYEDVPVVLVCDRLFADAIGAPCGGPAEAAWAATWAPRSALADRFDASARTAVSVYLPR